MFDIKVMLPFCVVPSKDQTNDEHTEFRQSNLAKSLWLENGILKYKY